MKTFIVLHVPSGSEFRRLVKQGGIQLNQEKVVDLEQLLQGNDFVLRVGKKKFIRIVLNN
ncbi:MAG: S4 domain-containing protein [Herbinix sp.]|nr:S4 domain-containing protein [Herbinix sp.]